ncbi:MAG: aminotransferase class V-fold PLP-dependent enzyme [Kiloniellales bacterium]|nr:aminotransferase class V-fold PLP-dependent enzyme [Kiloniellales bacterium]
MTGQNPVFIPGPTNIPERIRRACNVAMEDQRAPDLPNFTLPLFADLKRVFKSRAAQVFLFPGSGTGGWEAAITNTLSPGDKVLTSRFGHFSHLWVDLCERHKLDVIAIDVEWGKGVPVEEYARILEADTSHEIKAVLACHNETATGVTSDIAAVRRVLDDLDHPALLYVDGVSSIASIDFRMDEWGVDLAVSGSQKGFMLPTGLAIVAASPRALEARHSAELPRCFFDFEDMIKTNKDGYFPYTPAMSLIRGLRESVDMLLEEGLENVFLRHHRIATGVRRAVEAWGLSLCAKGPEWYSDTVSAVCVPDGFNGTEVAKLAYQRYGVSFAVGLNKVAGKVFRIGHLGAMTDVMALSGIATAEMAMRDLGIPVELGSGVAAAQDHYRQTAKPVDLSSGATATA